MEKGIFMIAGFYNLTKKTLHTVATFSCSFQRRKAVGRMIENKLLVTGRISRRKITIFIMEISLKNI
jgi:hypothetical protein